jgi:phospholipid-binding lipoprotein MlaA
LPKVLLRRAAPAILALTLALTLAACAAPPPAEGPVSDPFEAQNRRFHAINKGADRYALRPASRLYGRGVPGPLREGVSNFAENLSTPGSVVNDVLQGEVEDAGHNFFRFAINSTLGVAGLFDPATSIGLPERESDFGQTLHVWGAPEGAYLELPLLGPSTQRDFAGRVVDVVLNPLRHAASDEVRQAATLAEIGDGLDTRYRFGNTIDSILYDSADSYLQTREAYLQNRRFELGGDQVQDYVNPYDDLYAE